MAGINLRIRVMVRITARTSVRVTFRVRVRVRVSVIIRLRVTARFRVRVRITVKVTAGVNCTFGLPNKVFKKKKKTDFCMQCELSLTEMILQVQYMKGKNYIMDTPYTLV